MKYEQIEYIVVKVNESGLDIKRKVLNFTPAPKTIIIERGQQHYGRRISRDRLGIIEETGLINNCRYMGFETYVKPSEGDAAVEAIKVKIWATLRSMMASAETLIGHLNIDTEKLTKP